MQYFAGVRVGATKTQIVYSCNLNFQTVVPYLDLIINNGLAERVPGEHVRWRTTARGQEALAHMQALRWMMEETGGEAMGEEGVG